MLLPFEIEKDGQEPIYLQVKRHLARQIYNGLLPPGERLPPTRALADQLGVARISVVNAYEELKAEGLIEAQVGRGTFVAERFSADDAPQAAGSLPGAEPAEATLRGLHRLAERPDVINFSQGTPADAFLPVDLIRQAIEHVLERDGAEAVAYESPEGYPPLREAIARSVARLGIRTHADEVLITGGCQQALDLAVQSLLNSGDVLLTSNPTYLGMLDIARARGVTPVGVPTDADGMLTDQLETFIIEYRPRLLYIAPTYHNPTGAVMLPHRRRCLLDVARRYRLPVLEDGVYEELDYAELPPPPLRALDDEMGEEGGGLVLYASGFSKVLLPGMRIGYLLVGGALRERLVRVKQAADICTPSLNQRAIHAVLGSGQLAGHMEKVRRACRERRDAMLEAAARYLPEGASWSEPSGGLYLWVELPPGPTAPELYLHALRRGVAFAIGSIFHTDGSGSHRLRLNMVAHPPDVIAEGMRRLGLAWHELAAEHHPPATEATPHLL
jgi:2-aminoadipate transaminase